MQLRVVLNHFLEKMLGRYREGPNPPSRLDVMVDVYAAGNPNATVGEWAAFAKELAGEAYRSGYQRGYEYIERDPESWMPDVPPEDVMDQFDPDWRWSPPVDLSYDPTRIPPTSFERDEETEVLRAYLENGGKIGTWLSKLVRS